MHRMAFWLASFVLILSATAVEAQAQLSIRAASTEPVDGWQPMQVEHCQSRCVIWVSPTAAITASDIEKAEPEVRADGYQIIRVVFTDAGVSKLHDLTAAQLHKPIALIVDDRVLWAPMVMYIAGSAAKNNVLTGSTPHGLTPEEVERIMAILH
jgi:preprotein translocase subunit SecD